MSLSCPAVLEQQPSDKGNDVRFSNTLKYGFPTWCSGSFKVSNGKEKYIYILFVYKYLCLYQ